MLLQYSLKRVYMHVTMFTNQRLNMLTGLIHYMSSMISTSHSILGEITPNLNQLGYYTEQIKMELSFLTFESQFFCLYSLDIIQQILSLYKLSPWFEYACHILMCFGRNICIFYCQDVDHVMS